MQEGQAWEVADSAGMVPGWDRALATTRHNQCQGYLLYPMARVSRRA
jgi:hypothetical protein